MKASDRPPTVNVAALDALTQSVDINLTQDRQRALLEYTIRLAMCIALRMVFASLHTLKKQISAYCEKKCDLKPLGDADWRWCDRDAAWRFPAVSTALTDKLSCAACENAGRRRDIPRVCFPAASDFLARASGRTVASGVWASACRLEVPLFGRVRASGANAGRSGRPSWRRSSPTGP